MLRLRDEVAIFAYCKLYLFLAVNTVKRQEKKITRNCRGYQLAVGCTASGPSSSCEMIILRNKSRDEIIKVYYTYMYIVNLEMDNLLKRGAFQYRERSDNK